MWLSDVQKIGVGLTSGGIGFIFLGCILFFDRGLLALGNLLFLTGLVMVIGPGKALGFFVRPHKWRGTAAFFGGVALVLMKYTFIGILIEMFGFINLFGDFFPVLVGFLRKLPVVGDFLNMPGVAQVIDKLSGGQPSPVTKSGKADPRAKCQKCLQPGHWTADCTNQRSYVARPTRTALLKNPELRLPEQIRARNEMEELEKQRETAASEILAQSSAFNAVDGEEKEEKEEDWLSDTTEEELLSDDTTDDERGDHAEDRRDHRDPRPRSRSPAVTRKRSSRPDDEETSGYTTSESDS